MPSAAGRVPAQATPFKFLRGPVLPAAQHTSPAAPQRRWGTGEGGELLLQTSSRNRFLWPEPGVSGREGAGREWPGPEGWDAETEQGAGRGIEKRKDGDRRCREESSPWQSRRGR